MLCPWCPNEKDPMNEPCRWTEKPRSRTQRHNPTALSFSHSSSGVRCPNLPVCHCCLRRRNVCTKSLRFPKECSDLDDPANRFPFLTIFRFSTLNYYRQYSSRRGFEKSNYFFVIGDDGFMRRAPNENVFSKTKARLDLRMALTMRRFTSSKAGEGGLEMVRCAMRCCLRRVALRHAC